MPIGAIWAFGLVLTTAGFGFHALLEGKGSRTATLLMILCGAAPVLFGIVLAVSSKGLMPLAIWVTGVSPLAGPLYASGTVLPVADLDADLMRGLPRAFWFWQVVAALIATDLTVKLRRARREIAERSRMVGDRMSADE